MKFNKIEGKRSKLVRVAAASLLLAFLFLTIHPAAAAPQSLQARFIRWAGTVRPLTITSGSPDPLLVAAGGSTANQAPLVITGEFLIDNETGFHGPAQNVKAQVIIGPSGTPPAQWTVAFDAFYLRRAARYGINDMVLGQKKLQAELAPGNYRYAVRFSVDNGATWTYADMIDTFDPAIANLPDLGYLTVTGRNASINPTAPTNLQTYNVKPEELRLTWTPSNANGGSAVYGYHIFRSNTNDPATAKLVGQVIESVVFLDEFLQDGGTYYYWVRGFNQDYNYSGFSTSVMVETPELARFYLPIVNR